MSGRHRQGGTDRTLLWCTAGLVVFTLSSATLVRIGGGSDGVTRTCVTGEVCVPADDVTAGQEAQAEPLIEKRAVPTASPPPASPPPAPPAPPTAASPPPVASPVSTTRSFTSPAVERTPAWAAGVVYRAGARVTYNGRGYQCVQPHTSQSDWSPEVTPALWSLVSGS